MSDSYIRRSAAIDQICRHIGSLHTSREESLLVWVVGTLRTMPAADVAQVVRCENCKHVRPTVNVHTGEQVGIWCSLHDIINVSPDDYCSRGEKKGGDGHAAD